MRIITGKARGCKLKSPQGLLTRPTADRVKESLFNILGNEIYDARVLDLFAGTGNLGLEALSRGAAHATFVDHSPECFRVIQDNSIHTKLCLSVEIIRQDVFAALRSFGQSQRKFDLIFCDPPYKKGLAEQALRLMDELDLLAHGAILVMEHASDEEMKLHLKHIVLKSSRRYGAAMLSFWTVCEPCLAVTTKEEF